MPTYAILGATGSTGSAILRCLLSEPLEDLSLNLLVRSKAKLLATFPDLENTKSLKLTIVEGVPASASAMQECLDNVDVIMACIGSNYSIPGDSIIYETARALVSSLEHHRKVKASAYKTPTVIQLRTASLNPIFKAEAPFLARMLVGFIFYHNYLDLDRACQYFVSAADSSQALLHYIFVDPPSIHDADGTSRTGYKLLLKGKQEQALSYADLGAAFCEISRRRAEFKGQGVGVSATGAVNLTLGTTLGYMFVGIKGRIWG